MRLALYQPDIPQNLGTSLRLCACLGVAADVIEPCGFAFSVKALRRSGMDYMSHVDLTRHVDFEAFMAAPERGSGRLVLLTTRSDTSLYDFAFQPGDTLMLGRESAGVPDSVHNAADIRLRLPLAPGLRSINVAVAGAMALSEALRQTGAMADLGAKDDMIRPPSSPS